MDRFPSKWRGFPTICIPSLVTAVVSVVWSAIAAGTTNSQNVTVPNAPVGTSVYVALDPAIPRNARQAPW